MSSYSEFLSEGFTPNPYYDKMLSLLNSDNTSLLEDIIAAVQGKDLGSFGNDFSSDLIDSLVDQFDDQLDEIIDTFESTPKVDPYMPPAKPPVVLYGRICPKASVLDIGSGDGRKAEKAKVEDLVLSDVVVPPGRFSKRWKVVDGTDGPTLRAAAHGRVVTSYMVLGQLHDIDSVMQMDGIHVVPDVGFLLTSGSSMKDGKIRSRTRNKVWNDYPHDYGAAYQLSPGYLGVNTYSSASHWIELGAPFRTRPPKALNPLIAMYNTDPCATPKYDGIQLHFYLDSGGGGVVVNRAGLARRLSHNVGGRLEFVAEYCRGHYILLRVLHYRGFVPWHSAACLKKFTDAKNIDIGGDRLTDPITASGLGLPTDGLIMRKGEEDYRVKDYVGIDVDAETWQTYVDFFEQRDDDYNIDIEPGDGIVEYQYTNNMGVHTFRKLRNREDKCTVTRIHDFGFLSQA